VEEYINTKKTTQKTNTKSSKPKEAKKIDHAHNVDDPRGSV
jgi:hypothetical protein